MSLISVPFDPHPPASPLSGAVHDLAEGERHPDTSMNLIPKETITIQMLILSLHRQSTPLNPSRFYEAPWRPVALYAHFA
jgi:hypothetical protein